MFQKFGRPFTPDTCFAFCDTYHPVRREGLTPLLLLEDSAAQEFSDLDDGAGPDCVLVGLAPSRFHYDKLNEAFKLGQSFSLIIAKIKYFCI